MLASASVVGAVVVVVSEQPEATKAATAATATARRVEEHNRLRFTLRSWRQSLDQGATGRWRRRDTFVKFVRHAVATARNLGTYILVALTSHSGSQATPLCDRSQCVIIVRPSSANMIEHRSRDPVKVHTRSRAFAW